MISLLLILLPLLTGLAAFFIKDEKLARTWAVLASFATLTIAILSLCCMNDTKSLNYHCEWLPSLGASFSLKMDGVAQLLCLLNTIAYPLVFIAGWDKTYKNAKNFFVLILLAQAGIMGVFLAADALLFYFFWELALIPMYFLCSQWGGEKRVAVTFKFFIYTFIGEQAPTATTMILSGVMVKMGVFGLIRWLFPIFSTASFVWGDVITLITIIGMIYASLIALRQDDLKRLVAYSSIAHIGLLCAGMFTQNASGMQGVMIQMFSHGINIIGLWIVVDWIERKTGTRKMSELGGLAQKAPALTIFFVIIALANIALPLTNAFVGEFLIFNGLLGSFTLYNVWYTVLAGVCIILGAAYTLRMIRKVAYGEVNELTANVSDISINGKLALGIIVVLILAAGIYPQPILDLTSGSTDSLVDKFDIIRKALLK